MKKLVKYIIGDLLALDFAVMITLVTSIIYGIVFVQENYDKAVANQTKFYNQLNSQFVMFGHINGIRFEEGSEEPEEVVFLNNKSVLLKLETEGSKKILVISYDDSSLPK